MPKPRIRTRDARVKPEGMARWRHDAPPSNYRYNGKRPDKTAVYVTDGIQHRFDGKCHETCANVR